MGVTTMASNNNELRFSHTSQLSISVGNRQQEGLRDFVLTFEI